MSADKRNIDSHFLKIYRKYRKQGMKHRQAYEKTLEDLAEPKEKAERRKEKGKRDRRR